MPLFINEAVDKKLSKKTTVIPKAIYNLALKVKGEYGNNKTKEGYKIVNRLLDSSYNKGKLNDSGISAKEKEAPKIDNNDGLVKFPTSAARKMVNTLKKSKGFIDPQAKDTIVNYLQSDVKSKESAVKDNNNVPKVPKLSKPINVSKMVKPKEVKVGSSSNVTIHESKKKIKLTENQILLLKEYHNQLNIPFNHDTENYDFKEAWENLVDFFESIGRYGILPKSGYHNLKEIYEKCFVPNTKKVFDNYVEGENDEWDDGYGLYDVIQNMFLDYDYAFECLNTNVQENFKEYLNDYLDENGNLISNRRKESLNIYTPYIEEPIPFKMLIDFFSELLGDDFERLEYTDIISLFNEKGKEIFKKFAYNTYLKNFTADTGKNFILSMNMNKKGLIYVEREISIPRVHSKSQDYNLYNNNTGDYYDYLKRKVKNAGQYWTWEEGNGQAYCESVFEGGTDYIEMKGWVNPDSIDWLQTIYRNGYYLKNEKEIYVKEGSLIQVDKVIYNYCDKEYNLLQKPILLPA